MLYNEKTLQRYTFSNKYTSLTIPPQPNRINTLTHYRNAFIRIYRNVFIKILPQTAETMPRKNIQFTII